MSPAIKYAPRYTCQDYVHWKGDWELWDGIAIAMSPSPFGQHQALLVALASEIRIAIKSNDCDATVLVELDWIVREDTVVRPDVIVVCGDAPNEHLRSAPALVAEVLSDSTRRNDLTFKRDLYASEGVETYLIVDPTRNAIDCLRLTESGSYESHETVDAVRLSVCRECEIEVKLSDIFAKS